MCQKMTKLTAFRFLCTWMHVDHDNLKMLKLLIVNNLTIYLYHISWLLLFNVLTKKHAFYVKVRNNVLFWFWGFWGFFFIDFIDYWGLNYFFGLQKFHKKCFPKKWQISKKYISEKLQYIFVHKKNVNQ